MQSNNVKRKSSLDLLNTKQKQHDQPYTNILKPTLLDESITQGSVIGASKLTKSGWRIYDRFKKKKETILSSEITVDLTPKIAGRQRPKFDGTLNGTSETLYNSMQKFTSLTLQQSLNSN